MIPFAAHCQRCASHRRGGGHRLDGLSHGRRIGVAGVLDRCLCLPLSPHVLVRRLAVEPDVLGYLPVGVARQVVLDDLQLLPLLQIDHLLKIASCDSLAAGDRNGPFLKRNVVRI